MNKFFSNDRQVILKSAAAGIGIITFLYLTLSLNTDSIILWIIATCGLLAVYWFVPTWFSRNRPVEKREVKHFIPEGIEMNKLSTSEHQYFNADGREIKKLSSKEQLIAVTVFLVINIILIGFSYDKLSKILQTNFPVFKNAFMNIFIIFAFITPYFIRHIYHFVLNRPMNIPLTLKWTNTPYIHKYNNSSFRNTATSPSYSFLSYNINHRR